MYHNETNEKYEERVMNQLYRTIKMRLPQKDTYIYFYFISNRCCFAVRRLSVLKRPKQGFHCGKTFPMFRSFNELYLTIVHDIYFRGNTK